jgi:hypothetical protein
MNKFKKTLSSIIFSTTCLTGTVYAGDAYFWDYYNSIGNRVASNNSMAAEQNSAFDDSAHTGTYFWGYFNKDLNHKANVNTTASFDESKLRNTYFWKYYNK